MKPFSRRDLLWIVLLAVLMLLSPLFFRRSDDITEMPAVVKHLSEPVTQYISDVILKAEYGDSPGVCRLWKSSPTLYVEGGGEDHRKLLNDAVSHLNEVLEGTEFRLEVAWDKELSHADGPHIRVMFADRADYDDIKKREGLDIPSDVHAFFWIYWNENREITRAIVVLPVNPISNRLEHLVMEEITQSLGLSGDSQVFENSLFYENKSRRAYGTAVRLSPLDQKLLHFAYTHLKPNMGPGDVAIPLLNHWN